MTSRERVCAVLNHQEPDRVPMDLGGINTSLMLETHDNLKRKLGLGETPTQLLSKTWQIAKTDEAILDRLAVDIRYIFPEVRPAGAPPSSDAAAEAGPEDTFTDEWGIVRRFVKHYYEMEGHPLKEADRLEDIESYPWPDPGAYFVFEGLGERARELRENTDYAVGGYMGGGSIFEQAWYLRGYPELLIDFMVNKEFAHALLSKIVAVRKKNAELYLSEVGAYLDVFQIGDDIATQEGPAMSPELYREMLKPYQTELFQYIKERTPAKLYYHSCGGIVPHIDDLIEAGADALNPIQVTAKGMDTAGLKKRFGKRLVFWGAIDSQQVLPFGSPEDVRAEVRRRISDLGPGGGYILSGVHNLQPDISPENILAMYDEGLRFGKYPL
jgi:uroporphyrinogen decarboxylase